MNIGILYICTGKYSVFWKDFYVSYKKFFLTKSHVDYYVFTDDENLYMKNDEHVHVIYKECRDWPYDTLLRFDMFLNIKNDLKKEDYLFYMNANLRCVINITEEEILPGIADTNALVMVRHPRFLTWHKQFLHYERNKLSLAYIPYNLGGTYFAGGINGGKSYEYLNLIETLSKNIQEDLNRGIVACVHDESHLNNYALNRKDIKILSAEYCYPDHYNLNIEPRILLISKNKYFDVNTYKQINQPEPANKKFLRKGKKFIRDNVMYFVDSIRSLL